MELGHDRQNPQGPDPRAPERPAIARLEEIAWAAWLEGRKAPITRKAGRGFADPSYDTSDQWLDTARRLQAAQRKQARSTSRSRILRERPAAPTTASFLPRPRPRPSPWGWRWAVC